VSELPQVNETRCTGCGDCVLACPTDCLAMDGLLPWLHRPQDCISCAVCVLVCPVEAVMMVEYNED
jgi:formate hydrogenlyase subunit 6/NADH:ubiquinone oxidoreductase subunit I